MKVNRFLFILTLTTFCLSGCLNNEENSESTKLELPNVSDYSYLYVQGVDENGVSSEATSKIVKDDKKIDEFISKVNKMEVIMPPNKELTQKVKELRNPGNYIFVLSDNVAMDNKVYNMNFFKDGSIQFQHLDKNEIVYISKEKHPKLLKELKELLGIKY